MSEREERLIDHEPEDLADGEFSVDRRSFLQVLGAGVLVSVASGASTQRGSRGPTQISARIHVGGDGTITVMTGKVELGQGARAEITQAAAEELRVGVDRVRVIMADTDLVPNDGTTAGSRTTPSTVPAIRKGAAAAREALANIAEGGDAEQALAENIPDGVTLTPVDEWKVLGTSVPRPNARDIVTGAHKYASDISRPDMLHGKVLRPPAYGATLAGIDTSTAEAIEGVTLVRDGDFIGCVAPTLHAATRAVEALAKSATWDTSPQQSNAELWDHLREHAGEGESDATVTKALDAANVRLKAEYHAAYIQHAPMEPGGAVAEWNGDRLTIWVGSRSPFRSRSQLADQFNIPAEQIRVIVPDTGGGFGMKSGDFVGVEAARLAKAAGRPVRLQWTREEEFTWAYYRPAALIDVEAGLDDAGRIAAWRMTDINAGGSAVNTPYAIPQAQAGSVRSNSPLRGGSYRALASTQNNFARESFMDELATETGTDPLAFRLAHLQNPRLRAVLETAAERFDWDGRKASAGKRVGVGLACGTEKASYVAACVEVAVSRRGRIDVRHVSQVFECGAILNPANLLSQVYGCIMMGMGAALREEMLFENGTILNPRFSQYLVARFEDVPDFDVHLIDRPDIDPAGGGETPIIAIAPAIANAVFDAIGTRVREMPVRV